MSDIRTNLNPTAESLIKDLEALIEFLSNNKGTLAEFLCASPKYRSISVYVNTHNNLGGIGKSCIEFSIYDEVNKHQYLADLTVLDLDKAVKDASI